MHGSRTPPLSASLLATLTLSLVLGSTADLLGFATPLNGQERRRSQEQGADSMPASIRLYLPVAGIFTRSELVEAAEIPADGWLHLGSTAWINDLAVDDARSLLWAATDGGLLRWHPEDDTRLRYSHHPIALVAVDAAGRVWFGGGEDGAAEGLQVLEPGSGRPQPVVDMPAGRLLAIEPDPSGGVWLAFGDQRLPDGREATGALLRVGPDGSRRVFGRADGLPSEDLAAVAADGAGGAWLAFGQGPAGTSPVGVAHLAADGSLGVEAVAEGLSEPDVRALTVGPDGTLLALSKTMERGQTALFERQPSGRWRGVELPRDLPVRPYLDPHDRSVSEINRMAIDSKGHWWLVAAGGILRRDPNGRWEFMPDASAVLDPAVEEGLWSAFNQTMAFALGADGSAWLAGRRGPLVRWNAADAWSLHVGEGDLPTDSGLALSFDRAGLPWLVGWRAYRLERDARWRELKDPAGPGDPRCGKIEDGRIIVASAPDGSLWVGDVSGLWQVSLDGSRRKHDSTEVLSLGRVQAIAFGPDGSAWIGGSAGLAQALPGGTWRSFGPRDGLRAGGITAIAFDARGQIWVGGQPELHWSDEVFGCMRSGPASLWHVPIGGGWAEQALPAAESSDDGVHALLFEPGGKLLAAIGQGLYRREGDGTWKDIKPSVGLESWCQVTALAHDHEGRLWIATHGDGVRRVKSDGRWDAFGAGGGKISDSVRTIHASPDGSLWFGLAYPGPDGARLVRRRPDGEWKSYAEGWDAFWAHEIVSVAVDKAGQVWCGTGQGRLYRLDEAEGFRVMVLHDRLGQAADRILGLAQGIDGAQWLATTDGLIRRGPEGRMRTWHRADGLPSGAVLVVEPDPSGGVWAGFGWSLGNGRLSEGGGIGHVDADGRFRDESALSGLDDHWVRDLALGADGRLLAAVQVARVQGGRVQGSDPAGLALRDAAGRWHRHTSASGLPSDDVRAVAIAADGRLWAATDRGLARSDGGANWTSIGLADGLPSEDLRALRIMGDGTLWAGTAAGAAKLEPNGRWRIIRPAGRPEPVVDVEEDPGGNIWLLLDHGNGLRSISVGLR